MARGRKPLFIGTGRFVAALDAKTGEEIWRTKLPHSGTTPVVTLLLKDNGVYVGHGGRAYCLSQDDGTILWENGLPRMGWGAVLMTMEGATGCYGEGAVAADVETRKRAAAAGAGGAAAAT
jgi:outer membrane protein assembly factor BamB